MYVVINMFGFVCRFSYAQTGICERQLKCIAGLLWLLLGENKFVTVMLTEPSRVSPNRQSQLLFT